MTTVNFPKSNFAPLAASPSIRPGWSSGLNPGAWTGIGAMTGIGQTLQQMVQKQYQQKLADMEFQRKVMGELLQSQDPQVKTAMLHDVLMNNGGKMLSGLKLHPDVAKMQNMVKPPAPTPPPMPGASPAAGGVQTNYSLDTSPNAMNPPPSQFMNRRTPPAADISSSGMQPQNPLAQLFQAMAPAQQSQQAAGGFGVGGQGQGQSGGSPLAGILQALMQRKQAGNVSGLMPPALSSQIAQNGINQGAAPTLMPMDNLQPSTPGGAPGDVPPGFLGRPPAADVQGDSGQQAGPLAQPSGANNPVLPQNQPPMNGASATLPMQVTPPPAQPNSPDAAIQALSSLQQPSWQQLMERAPIANKVIPIMQAAKAMGMSPEDTQQMINYSLNPQMSKVIYQQGEQDRRQDKALTASKEKLTTTEAGKATRQKTAIEARTTENQVAVPNDLAKAMQLPQGAKIPKVLLHEYEQNLRSAQATGGKIDAAKIFAQAATNRMLGTPIPVLTTDDGTPTGHPVTQYMSRADATNHVFTRPEIATIRDRQMVAGTSSAVGHDLLHEIEDGDGQYHDSVGPVLGRYNNLAAAAGEGDPTAQQLKGEIMGWTSMLMKVHGSRAYKIASDARDLLSTAQTPEALSGGLRGLLTISDKLSGTDNQSNGATPTKAAPAPPGVKPAKDPLGIF